MSDWDSTAYEVARVEVGADGRFDLPRPVDAARVRVRLEGDYARGGSIEYDLGSDDEPAGDVFEVPVELGAHVTLALIPPPGASPSEFARLTGREASLHSSTAYVVGRSEHAGTVGPDGQVILRRLPEGTCGFTNSYTGAAPLAPFFVPNDFSFTAEAGVRSVVEVPLLRGREFSGRVETEDGTRVPGAEITLEFAVRSPSSGRSWSRRETSDVTGHFWFEAMQAAPRACTVKLDRGRPVLALEGAALEALLAVDDPALVVPSTRTVRVRFRMPDGRAARFLHVDIRFPEAPDLNTTARTADDGTVRVVLPVGRRVEVTARGVRGDRGAAGSEGSVDFERPGPVAPFVRGPGSDPAAPSENTIARDDRPLWFATVPGERIAAAREDTPVEVELEPAPIVSGFVSGADPSEALGPRVTLLTLEEARRRRPRELEGQEGVDSTRSLDRMAPAFAFAAVPGEYVAYASRGRGASMTVSEPVTVAVGPDGATVGLTLPPRRRLEGRLVDTTNAPLAEIHVGLQGTGDRRLSINRETTDERGVFRFERVLPGTYTCWLDSERYVLATKPRVVIAADSPPPPVELVASPAGAIRARAVGPDGLERPECGFDVRSAEGRHFGRRMIKDDRAWRGAIGPLLPGTYTVEAYCGPDGAPDRSGKSPLVSASATVEVRPGALSTVEVVVPTELGASVRGRITAGGSPVREANAWLELDGGPTVSSRTDEDGRFELPVPGAGAGTLRCNAEWGRGGVIVERRIQ
ncbi:MAG: carboxypeptidase-like regulatory domain-containing protein, partial [Planctomycetota bacterium]